MNRYPITEGPAAFIVAMSVANGDLVPFRMEGPGCNFIFQAMVEEIARAGGIMTIAGKGWPEGAHAPESPPGMQPFIGHYSHFTRTGWISF